MMRNPHRQQPIQVMAKDMSIAELQIWAKDSLDRIGAKPVDEWKDLPNPAKTAVELAVWHYYWGIKYSQCISPHMARWPFLNCIEYCQKAKG